MSKGPCPLTARCGIGRLCGERRADGASVASAFMRKKRGLRQAAANPAGTMLSPPRQKPRRARPLLSRQARPRARRARRAPAPAPQPAPRLPAPPRSPPRSHSFRTLPQRFGELAVPVAQSSRWALAAPSARFAPHLRVALGLRPKCPQGTRFPPVPPGGKDRRQPSFSAALYSIIASASLTSSIRRATCAGVSTGWLNSTVWFTVTAGVAGDCAACAVRRPS